MVNRDLPPPLPLQVTSCLGPSVKKYICRHILVASASYLHIVIVESSYRWTVDSLLCHLPVLIPKALDANFRPASGIQGLKSCFCNSSAQSSLGLNSLPPEPELHHSNHPTAATPRTSINLKSSFLYIFLQKSMACQVCTLIDFKENSSTRNLPYLLQHCLPSVAALVSGLVQVSPI